MSQRSPYVFVGSATWDTIALVHELPARDTRVEALEIVCAGGGPAATAAVTAARLGVPDVHFVGTVGSDESAEQIMAGLADAGVNVAGVMHSAIEPSGQSVVLVESAHGSRSIVNRPSPGLDLSARPDVAELIASAAWVHTDHIGIGGVRRVLRGSGAGPRLSVDGGNPIAGFTPVGVELDVPTERALRLRYPGTDPDLDDLLGAAVHDGARTVVVTRGAEGSAGASGDTFEVASAVSVEARSTLGAGDVFHGALLAAVIRGEPLAGCLTYANTVAAMSCRGLDGRSAIPTHDEAVAFTPSTEARRVQ